MRVVVVGPTIPFRGGIAHYTTVICRELAKNNDVSVISFSQLYPKWIMSKPQKDAQQALPTEFPVHAVLDPLNPFTWWHAVKQIRAAQPERLILQWWTTFLAPCYLFILLSHGTRAKVGIMAHNIFPHPTEGNK
jgi:hypothetical protein